MIMKKILSFFAVLLMAMTASATIRNITPTHCFEGDRADGYTLYVEITRGAQAGDTIVMADGIYVEPLTIAVANDLVVMAAEGANPVVQMSGYFDLSASIKFYGITFDHTAVTTNSYLAYFRTTDCHHVVLEGCEVTGFRETCIMSWEAYHLDSIILNNCYFHNIIKSVIYVTSNQCDKVVVTNSTFANIHTSPSPIDWSASVIDVRNDGSVAANQIVRVDHCTFYNCKTLNTDHAPVLVKKSTDVIVSNCIFAWPETYDKRATYLYGGNVNNCLTFNTNKDTGTWGHHSGPAFSNCSMADPLFVDTANCDFTLGAGSPALGAGTDGSNLGDPYWWPRTIYLYNALNWTAPHVNLYKGPYWDNSLGSGNYAGTNVVKANVEMTQVESKFWKADYSGNRYPVVSFTEVSQPNYGNFYGEPTVGVIYRGDFDANAKQNMFIPNTTSTETKNTGHATYFSNGIWVPYTGNTYTVTYEDLNYKTLCLPFGGTLTGANAYTVTGVDEGAGTVTLSEPTTTLTAGVAYIIKPTALTVSVAFAGEPVTVGTLDYLRGNLNAADWKVDNSWWAYILLDNEFCLISSAATANVPQFKAILKANNTSLAPTLRIIETATNIQNVEGNEAAVKFVKNGQLYIQKDGVTYTAAGVAVK